MPERDPPARLSPVGDDLFEEGSAFMETWKGGFLKPEVVRVNPVLRTFAHNPALAAAFSQFNVHLLTENSMPVRLRQIAIMRLAWITKATYMWSSHLSTSRSVGLEDDFYEPVKTGSGHPHFTLFENTVLAATDELVQTNDLSDETWNALRDGFDEKQMLDFLFTVGCYLGLAGTMNACRVERMDDLLELAERYGEP